MKRVIALFLTFGVVSVNCSPAFAIVIRHDVPDAKYIELAAEVPSPVILMTNESGSADGMGVWVAPDWILTAAHVAEMIAVGDYIGPKQEHQVAEVVVHADWPDAPVDVALVRVSRAAEGVKPIEICAMTELEDRITVFIGAGDSGDGTTGPIHADGKMRAARNRISSASEQFISFVFDAPDSEAALELEGISGPGDSGGPAYLSTMAGFCMLAVSSGQNMDATGGLEGRYGVVEYYSRVDVLRDWIKAITAPSNDR